MKFKIKFVSIALLLISYPSFGFEINTHQAITKCALSSECIGITDQQGAENLNYFAQTMLLNFTNYEEQKFEGYEENKQSYFVYAKEGDGLGEYDKSDSNKIKYGKYIGFKEGKTYLKNATDEEGNIILGEDDKPTNLLSYTGTSYISLIEAGSILEDATYPHADPVAGGDGRFNNHFYSAQFSVAARTPYVRDALINTVKKTFIEAENLLRESDTALISHGAFDAYGHRTDNISWALDSTISSKAKLT
jgi:hypothetical protein